LWINNQDIMGYYRDIILNCNLLFFNIGIVVSIIVDYYILNGIKTMKPFEIFCISLLPVLILASSIFEYFNGMNRTETFSFNRFLQVQQIIIVMSIIYTIGMKAYAFAKGEKNEFVFYILYTSINSIYSFIYFFNLF